MINKKLILTFLSLSLALISFFSGGRYFTSHMKVLYISKTEIMNIEKARIERDSQLDKQLFFGKPDQAIKYIEQAQKQRSKIGVLVLLSDQKIYGSNVRSISQEVHEEIIKNLNDAKS